MVNPWQMQQLGKEIECDILDAARSRAVSQVSSQRVRARLGRSLIHLGERLSRDPRPAGGRGHLPRDLGGKRLDSLRSLTRP